MKKALTRMKGFSDKQDKNHLRKQIAFLKIYKDLKSAKLKDSNNLNKYFVYLPYSSTPIKPLDQKQFDEFKSLYKDILSVLTYKDGDVVKNRIYGTDDTLNKAKTTINKEKGKYGISEDASNSIEKLNDKESELVGKLLDKAKPKVTKPKETKESTSEPEKPDPVTVPTRQLPQAEVTEKLKSLADGENITDVPDSVQKAIRKCLGLDK
jgi:hypothetical protein